MQTALAWREGESFRKREGTHRNAWFPPSLWESGNAYYDLGSQLWSRDLSIHDFLAPVVIKGDEEPCTELAQTPLEGPDLRWSIPLWGELFQRMEDVHSCEFRVGK